MWMFQVIMKYCWISWYNFDMKHKKEYLKKKTFFLTSDNQIKISISERMLCSYVTMDLTSISTTFWTHRLNILIDMTVRYVKKCLMPVDDATFWNRNFSLQRFVHFSRFLYRLQKNHTQRHTQFKHVHTWTFQQNVNEFLKWIC